MKKISGFTLAETLVAFGIISVLIGAALVTLKPFDKNIKYLYSATYHNLDKALYNTMTYWVNKISNPGERNPFVKSYINIDKSTSTVSSVVASEKLCKALTEYINTTGEGSCSYKNAVSQDAGADDFADDKVMFTATNGVRFWISQRYPANNDTNWDTEIKYFIIYADMNGTKKPNSVEYESGEGYTIDPDIFAFAALETGRVVPLGPPEVDSRYMTTRIKYMKKNSDDVFYSEPSQEYVKSQAEAWGYNFPEDKLQKHKNQNNENKEYMEETPFSFNGYLRSKLGSSKIYSFLGTGSMEDYVHKKFDFGELNKTVDTNIPNSPDNPDYGCVWHSDNECQVIIDSYVW